MTMTNEEASRVAKQIAGRAVIDWRDACGKLSLSDVSEAQAQMDRFEAIADLTRASLNALIDSMDEDLYEEPMIAAAAMEDAHEEAARVVTEMIDKGMADEGYEGAVYRVMDDEVLPALEGAADDFEAMF